MGKMEETLSEKKTQPRAQTYLQVLVEVVVF